MTMKISKKGIEFIKKAEGFKNHFYYDSAGLMTIGVGHLLTRSELTSGKIYIFGETVKWREGLTDLQINQLLDQDLDSFESDVNEAVRVPMTQYEFDSLVSFSFNVGRTAFFRSTLLKRINSNASKSEISRQFGRWVRSGGRVINGLINRRNAEVALFTNTDYGSALA